MIVFKYTLISIARIILLMLLMLTIGCSKKDISSVPPVPDNFNADAIKLSFNQVFLHDINQVFLNYQISFPTGENYRNFSLHWSTQPDFAQGDSLILKDSLQSGYRSEVYLRFLKQQTKYYIRLGFMHKQKKYYGADTSITTGNFILENGPKSLSRGMRYTLQTNWKTAVNFKDTTLGVFLNGIPCDSVTSTLGFIWFTVPENMPSRKYILKIKKMGMEWQSPDSIPVLSGNWKLLPSPEMPYTAQFPDNTIIYYAACQSPTKGYVVGGNFLRQLYDPNLTNPARPPYILEWNDQSRSWSRIMPVNPDFFFDNHQVQYAQNNIYVLCGRTLDANNGNIQYMDRLIRFDLSSRRWIVMNRLPYRGVEQMISFSHGNAIYAGMGLDGNRIDRSTGSPLPYQKLWKYVPATNTWHQMADFPGYHFPAELHATTFTIGNKAYVFYGHIENGPLDRNNPENAYRRELWEYNIDNDSWRQITLPEGAGMPPGQKYSVVTHNGKAYFLTMQRRQLGVAFYYFALHSPCLEWDPQTGKFTPISQHPLLTIMQPVFQSGNRFVFFSDALGFLESAVNRVFELQLD
jgi:hypothetical protein